jgi:hypothetical protein
MGCMKSTMNTFGCALVGFLVFVKPIGYQILEYMVYSVNLPPQTLQKNQQVFTILRPDLH